MTHPAAHSEIVAAVVHVLITAVSVLVVGKVLPGITVKSFGSALWFAVVVSILNALVWHFLPLAIASYAFALLTAGIGALILNGILFLVADKIATGVQISGCFMAAIAALCVTLLNGVFGFFVHRL